MKSASIHRVSGPLSDRELLGVVERILAPCEDLYPGIDLWLRRTALPGILAGERAGFVAYLGAAPIAAAIAKYRGECKLCSLRVLPGHQRKGVGTALFAAAASTLVRHGHTAFFTAPEALAVDRRAFFESLGFHFAGKYPVAYRRGEAEILFCGETGDVLRRARHLASPSLFGWMAAYCDETILMSVRPGFANEILEGRKTVELRRRFPKRHVGATIILYASAPDQRVVGTARVGDVRTVPVQDLAARRIGAIRCSREELLAYANGRESLVAIELTDVEPLPVPLKRTSLEREFGIPLRPPVSYQLLGEQSRWSPLRKKLRDIARMESRVAAGVEGGRT